MTRSKQYVPALLGAAALTLVASAASARDTPRDEPSVVAAPAVTRSAPATLARAARTRDEPPPAAGSSRVVTSSRTGASTASRTERAKRAREGATEYRFDAVRVGGRLVQPDGLVARSRERRRFGSLLLLRRIFLRRISATLQHPAL